MRTGTFEVKFYIEGNEDAGYYAWQSATSPNEMCGWGKTSHEAVSNLCRLLSGEFTEPVEKGKIASSGRKDRTMDEQKMKLIMAASVGVATEGLTDLELSVLNNVAQLGIDPHGRAFDYEKVKSLFTEKDGMRMHEETKAALAAVVNRRLNAPTDERSE